MERNNWYLNVGFDEMSHEYHRYRYHIEHCEADWTTSEDIFESDYLIGLNDQPIEDYEKSFNTTNLYTHYSLDLPNEDTNLSLSGNYRISIFDDDDDERPVATVEFCLVDPLLSIGAIVSGDTDIDFQRSHQQLSISATYGSLRVSDPDRELKFFVTQNRRQDSRKEVKPNIKKAGGVEFTHHRDLIFPGGSEYHKFDLLDVHRVNMNVDNIRWVDPYYHVTLYELRPQRSYVYDEEQNGAYIMRNVANEDNETTSEYAYIHFRLKTAPLPGGDVYVQGLWCNDWPCDEYKMEYNKEEGEYQTSIFLKQGYYNYRFVQLSREKTAEGAPISITDNTDGNFFETENEYQILVYHKEPGGRYDKLVGYNSTKGK